MSDDGLDAGMRQIVKDLASDPSLRSHGPVRNDWYRDDNVRPMTKREAREIIEAIKAIPVYRGTETNKLLAEIKDHLSAIKWLLGVLVVALIVFVSHRLTHG